MSIYQFDPFKVKTSAPITLTQDEENLRSSLLQDKDIKAKASNKRALTDMDDFAADYPNSIEKDKSLVKQIRISDGDKSTRAEILSDIFSHKINDFGWLGEKAYVSGTTEYDDRINHTDVICEFDNITDETPDAEPSFLAIDCTVSEDETVLAKKMGYIEKGLKEKELLGDVKYYEPKLANETGLKNIPRVIICVTKEQLQELSKTLFEAINNKQSSADRIKASYVQLVILYEIRSQLDKQRLYVIEKFKSTTKKEYVHKSLVKTVYTIEKLIEKKESSLNSVSVERARKEFASNPSVQFLAEYDFRVAA